MTEALDETIDGTDRLCGGRIRARTSAPTCWRSAPASGAAKASRPSCASCSRRARCRWCFDADALNAFADEPAALVGREGPRPDHHAASRRDGAARRAAPWTMCRRIGMGIARDFASAHKVYVVLKGYRTLIATPDGKIFVNPTGSSGHGHRRHRRRAGRHARRLAGAAARRGSRLPAGGRISTARRASWPTRTKGEVSMTAMRSRRAHRRRDPRAHRPPPRRAEAGSVTCSATQATETQRHRGEFGLQEDKKRLLCVSASRWLVRSQRRKRDSLTSDTS